MNEFEAFLNAFGKFAKGVVFLTCLLLLNLLNALSKFGQPVDGDLVCLVCLN
jgi:hypothetical protein